MTIETLQKKLETGEVVIFKEKNGSFRAIGGAGRDIDGNFRDSGWCATSKETKQYIGYCRSGYSQEKLEEKLKTWKYIESYPHALGEKAVPTGTKVRILDNVEEECEKYNIGFFDEKKEMIGKVFEITAFCGCDYRINDNIFSRLTFIIEPECEEEFTKEEKELIKDLREKGYTISK